jgi:hypothetical protein
MSEDNMKEQVQTVTTLPPAPIDERKARMIRYSITMGIRMVCIILMLFVSGWWLLIAGLGAVFLPYFAVVAANVGSSSEGGNVLRPGGLVPLSGKFSENEDTN